MKNLIVLLALSLFSVATQAQDFSKGWGSVTVKKVTRASLKGIKALPAKDRARIRIKETVSQEGFDKLCKTLTDTEELHFGFNIKLIKNVEAIGNLTKLKSVKVDLNQEEGEKADISFLNKLKDLEVADFYGTEVTGTKELKGFAKLKELSFYMSAVDNIDFIANCPNLEELSLYGFGHTFTDYKPLVKLKKLKVLNIYMNETATDDKLKELAALTSLRQLRTSNNSDVTNIDFLKNCKEFQSFNGAWMRKLKDISAFAYMPNLQTVELDDAAITDINVLKGKTKLEELDIQGTKVMDLSPLKDCKNLNNLSIEDTKIKDISIVKHLPNLRILSIAETEITDLTVLTTCENLSSLNLLKTPIKDLSVLYGLKKLDTLYLSKDFPEAEIEKLKAKRPELTINQW